MIFKPIASSSQGNAYLLESKSAVPLLLEAGIPATKLKKHLGFTLHDLAGCLISHEHGDHAKAVKDLLKAGIDCYMSSGTAETLGIKDHHRTCVMAFGDGIYRIQGWNVIPLPLKHDAAEPFGFIISDREDTLLFIPDTAYVHNRFENITKIAIECNHIEDILHDNIMNGLPAVVGRRVRRNHMSLEVLIKMLQANDLSKCKEIHLLHLSNGNSDEQRMIREVQEETGIPTYAAQ